MTEFYGLLVIVTLSNCVILSRRLGPAHWLTPWRQPSVAALYGVTAALTLLISSGFAAASANLVTAISKQGFHPGIPVLLFLVALGMVVPALRRLARRHYPLLFPAYNVLLPQLALSVLCLGLVLMASLTARQPAALMMVSAALLTAIGFVLLILIFGAMRPRLASRDIPAAMRGLPVEMITAGIMALVLLAPLSLSGVGTR